MSNNIKILLVEDDANLGSLLQEYLIAKGYDCQLETDGDKGIKAFLKNEFDLCALDVMMPIKDGFTLAKEIRNTNKEVPIIFLTAKSLKEDKIEGFQSGADDYLTKPFSMEELLLRIKAILRRTNGASTVKQELKYFEIGSLSFDYDRRVLKGKEDPGQKLTSKEADLLKLLCENTNDVLERNVALNKIWKDDSYFNARSMDVYITKLRKYLKADPKLEIVNMHGRGFKLLTT
ncbi:response regulator transcription factor [Flavobacteriales bacterium]|jgi:two-component system, OmpR family, response regulator|nr:response regulator transcription factor [Flavobacteriales bacterium]